MSVSRSSKGFRYEYNIEVTPRLTPWTRNTKHLLNQITCYYHYNIILDVYIIDNYGYTTKSELCNRKNI